MARYRKKPVEVEACRFTRENADEIAEWCDSVGYDRYVFGELVTKVLEIKTLESVTRVLEIKTLLGTIEAVEGDYVIRDAKGEFYSCKPEVFEQTYELVA